MGRPVSFAFLWKPLDNLNNFQRNKMLTRWALALLSCLTPIQAKPFPQYHVPPDPVTASKVNDQALAANDCPGYAASNVVTTESSLTADLTLAGNACNVFSSDITKLKLEVEYQTGR